MKKTHRRMLLMCMVLCLAFVTGVHAVGAAESRQSGQWLYQIVEDGTAEILGYLDPDAVSLSVPAQLDDAWVTSIGEDAFAANTALEEITIPVQVASIAETAFSAEGMPVIRARNGSQALRYAQEKHFPTQNLSEFDFFEDVVDLSEMGDGLWSLQDGMLRLEEPFASLVEPGDELYLPARGSWSQGMPVRITSVTNEGAAVRASYAVLSLTEALASYQVEDVTLYPDYGSLILGEGVSLAPAARSAVSGDLSAGQTFDINKSFENGVTVTGRVGAMVYATASVDYEWLHVRELSVSLEEQLAVYLKVHYDGEEEDNASITRSFLLYRAPFLGSGLVGAWVDVYVKIGLSGEATLEAQVTTTQQLTLRDGDIVSKKCAVKSSEATVEANATLHGGVSLGPVLRLGFPGTENTPYIDLASFSIYGGIAGTASYTTEAPYCYDLNVKTEVSAEVAYGAALKVGDDEKAGGLKTAELGELSFPLWHKHWEGPDERWQDFCTYADLCTVSIYTGTDETMEPILVRRGEKIGAPKAPEREGYTFTGWYAGETLARAFDFTMPIVSDTMLYAGWAEDTPEPTPTPEPTSEPTPEPTSEPMPEPTPTESPTQRPTTAWYPLEDIPSAAETFDMCQILPNDMDGDGTAEFYVVIIPDGLSAVTLSKTYNGKPVTWIWSNGYHSQPIAAVTYTNEYTTITGADMPPYGARTVYLPDSVTSMEDLGNISAIAHIRLSGNLRNIPAGTFAYTGLEEIVIPDSVTSIGESAFHDCENLQSVEMGTGVTSIGYMAFYGCSSLASVVIPDSVASIGNEAFSYCSSLASVVIHDSVTSIGEYAFSDCENLQSVEMGTGVTSIGNWAFSFCSSLASVVIPDSVTSIGGSAFYCCENLQSVEMGNGVTSIGWYAFYECDSLASVVIPDSVTSISSWTFYGCSSLESVEIGTGVTSIDDYAFKRCSSLESVVIPDSVTSIGVQAFNDCENLQNVEMGAGVTSIGYSAFSWCTNLQSVEMGAGVTSIGYSAFSGCENLESIVIPDSVTSIDSWTFQGCSSLASIVIPDSVTSIGEEVFSWCTNLQSVEMGTGMTSIGEFAFDECDSLTSIVIPDSVTHIGENAFFNCSSLQAITLPARLQMMNSMLYGCESLTEIKTLSKDMTIDFSYLHFDGTNLKLLRAYEDSTLAEYVRQRYPHVRIVPPDMEGYFVSFETQRGTQPADLFVAPGELIPEPETPVWDSRVFEGWYKDWLRTEPWDFASDRMPSEDITLYAKWSYQVTGTIINRNNRSYLAPPLVDPEEDLSIPQTIGTSVIVGLMPDLVPAGVKTVHLSGLIEDIRPGAFRLATDLTSITVDEDNTHYYAVDGVLYASDGTLVCYPAGKQEASFEVPHGTTQIEKYAFSDCSVLEELTFPETLTSLSAAAIHDCNALQRVTFAADPLQIGESNFLGSAKLRIFGPTDAGMLSAYAEANALSYNEYRLVYCSEGVVLAEIRMAAGEPLQLIGGPERAERILLGWSEDAAAQAPTDFSQAVMPARDLMLHAVWGYAFSWQEDGEGVELLNYNGEQKIIRVPETVDGKLVTAIADGAFDGLKAFTLEGNRGSVTEAYAAAKGYAFLPLSHTLRFESNGGTQLPPQTLCATDAVVIPACVRTGYDLTGWYTDGGLTQRWTGSTMPTNDLTLYAGWQPNGQTPQEVPFTYRTAADGIYITGYTGEAISVSVPAEINGVSVVGIDEAAFAGNTKIQNLYLPPTVNSIGAYAFQGMTSMTNISLPSQVSVLPKGVFQGCSFLSYMYIPDSVQRIESAAFKGCSHLEYVTIPLALESLASDAFTGCDALGWFDLYGENPYFSTINGVLFTDQGTRLLMYPRNLNVLYEIPSGVTAIDAGVRFPTQLEYLIIPDSVTELSVDNFAMRSSHLAVQVEPGSAAEAFFVENLPDVELTYEGWPAPGQGLHIVVPWDEVFQVGKPVQFRCTLDGVELEPDAVTWSVDQPEIAEITADGVLTFHHAGAPAITATLKADPTQTNTSWPVCYSDEGIWLPVGLKEIEDEAFCGSPMEEVDMPDGLERVGSRAFADCPWLFGVFVPNSVEYIADDAFSGSPYVCIYAEEGSYAIEYAQRMNLNFSYVYSVVPSL